MLANKASSGHQREAVEQTRTSHCGTSDRTCESAGHFATHMQSRRHASSALRLILKKKMFVSRPRGVSNLEVRVTRLPNGQRLLGVLANDLLPDRWRRAQRLRGTRGSDSRQDGCPSFAPQQEYCAHSWFASKCRGTIRSSHFWRVDCPCHCTLEVFRTVHLAFQASSSSRPS